jgi:23S rRNA (cytosine1962-C5)-methyltransferase
MNIQLLKPETWGNNYELIDSGGFEKLERFGQYITARPEPQAAWDKSLSESEWNRLAQATFKKEKGSQEKGEWLRVGQMPEKWYLPYKSDNLNLTFKLSLSSFKHVGVFPEQATNWEYLAQKLPLLPVRNPRVLNLFAYTGGASIASKAFGADVTHVDSVKQCISWARENMEASKLDNIRWMVEDAFKFVQREVRRGNQYHCIIMDPPAYGRGPAGEKWVLEEQINELLKVSAQLLDPEHYILILNMYSMGFSSVIADNLVASAFAKRQNSEVGELYLEDKFKKKLPLGVFYRMASV